MALGTLDLAPPLPAAGPRVPAATRLLAVDALRGLVMVLMTLDHASGAFNGGRLTTDSPGSYRPGTALDPTQFYARWVTHLCAPTFVFLAGLSLALSMERRRARGDAPLVGGASAETPGELDRFLITRGLFIAACDPLWMSWAFGVKGRYLLQVLYAIGMSFVAMAALRRLPRSVLGALALAVMVGHEALAGLAVRLGGGGLVGGDPGPARSALALLLTGGRAGPFAVAYPVLPWLAVMALGYASAGLVAGERASPSWPRRLSARWLAAAVPALALFVVVRGVDGYGNLGLHRDDGSLVQWLHVCKYPPSLSYLCLELGLMALLLALLLRVGAGSAALAPLVLLGQTAFFFYLLHVHLLEGVAHGLGLVRQEGLAGALLAAAATVAVLSPLCAVYRRYKAAHPDGWARYV